MRFGQREHRQITFLLRAEQVFKGPGRLDADIGLLLGGGLPRRDLLRLGLILVQEARILAHMQVHVHRLDQLDPFDPGHRVALGLFRLPRLAWLGDLVG